MATSIRSRGVTARLIISDIMTARLMKPSPPICISVSMTIWPNRLQCVAVSTVTSPVTQVALTAVKAASSGGVKVRETDEMGSIKSSAPSSIIMRKPIAITPVVRRFELPNLNLCFIFMCVP